MAIFFIFFFSLLKLINAVYKNSIASVFYGMLRGHAQRCSDGSIVCFWDARENVEEAICCICDCGLKLDYVTGRDNMTMFQYANLSQLRCPSSESRYESMLCGKVLMQYQSQISTPLSFCIGCKKTKDRLVFKNQPPSICVDVREDTVSQSQTQLVFTSSSGQTRLILLDLSAKVPKSEKTQDANEILFGAKDIMQTLSALRDGENITLCNFNAKRIECFECLQRREESL
jgi:hypothetical protein